MRRATWSGLFMALMLAACGSVHEEEPICGDGRLDPGEQCDDGNMGNADGCSSTCAIEMTCGNGVMEGSEEWDDGNVTSGDGCSASCASESQYMYAVSWSFRTVANAVQAC